MSDLLHSVTLPSLGLYYGGSIPGGLVQIKEMTGHEEAILYGDGDFTDRIDALVNATVVLPSIEIPDKQDESKSVKTRFDPMQLLDTDRFFLLIQVRKFTWGPTYSFDHRCSECKTQQSLNFDLDDLGITNPPADAQSEPIGCDLPHSDVNVGYGFLRGKDVNRITRMTEQAKVRGELHQMYPYRYAMMLQLVEGQKAEWSDKYDLIQNLHARDMTTLKKHIREHESGPQTRTDVRCGSCGFWDRDVVLPLNAEFFRHDV